MVGRKAVLVVGAVAFAAWGASTLAVAGASTSMGPMHITIETAGIGSFAPNGFFKETVRFAKSSYTIASGGTITFEKGPQDKTADPHTLTVVSPSQVPQTPLQVELCLGGVPGTGCAIGDHAKGPVLTPKGTGPGLKEPGDSYQLFPNHAGKYTPLTIKVTAPAGTTLNFMCSVHPWMQAVLHVV
jgi:hypothetical protein